MPDGSRQLIQDALPELTPGERELILTGSHEACFNTFFPDEEEEPEIPTCEECGHYLDQEDHAEDCPRYLTDEEAVAALRNEREGAGEYHLTSHAFEKDGTFTAFGTCPNCGAEYPDYHSPAGTAHTLCDICGWSSKEE
jgi:hypothetical protein